MPMGRLLLLVFILSIPYTALSQDIALNDLFSQRIEKNIKRHMYKSQEAYADNDLDRAKFLFDSLVKHVVTGSYLDNFKVRKRSGRRIEMNDFEKPIYLKTHAAWCTPGIGEISALNEAAKKYHKEIEFVVLFWDSKRTTRQMSRKYSGNVTILFVDERENINDHVVENLKHSLGFPTSFLVNADKMILDVRRGILNKYDDDFTDSFNAHYNSILSGVSFLVKNQGEIIAPSVGQKD